MHLSWLEKLPHLDHWRTFSDAIEITRRLGFSYVWIDSLCIIQDSIDDWQGECSQMCDVYRRSARNIAAESARDDTEGCFSDRDVNLYLPSRIYSGAPEDEEHGIAVIAASNACGSLHGAYDICSAFGWQVDIELSILNSRGWILQERMISPRILHFTKSQMYWECNELRAIETYPYGVPKDTYTGSHLKSLASRLESEVGKDHADEEATSVWGLAVMAFTNGNRVNDQGFSRNLSEPSDKLIAISAIARELQLFINSNYIAGHWEKELVRQLTWTAMDGSVRSDVYRALSWSWASVDAGIDQFVDRCFDSPQSMLKSEALAELVEVKIELETDDAMGQVKSGFLRLRCKLIEVDVLRVAIRLEEDEDFLTIKDRRTVLHMQRDEERYPMVTPCRLLFLPIYIGIATATQTVHLIEGILLEECEYPRTYRRVGYLGPGWEDNSENPDYADDPIVQAIGVQRDVSTRKLILNLSDSDKEVITII